MSTAGIQSNRGDGYQTLVAFDWALTILSNPDYQWIEVESVNWPVDDVVIGKTDGSIICCQCKKNQPQHKAWSVADLKDELFKAIDILENNNNVTVYFYSRSAFGDIAALKEFSINYADEASYTASLGKAHCTTNTALKKIIADRKANISTYQLLQHLRFEISPDLNRMQEQLRERLRLLASNHQASFNAFWTRLDHLGMRETNGAKKSATRHRLTKDDLKELLHDAGSILSQPVDIAQIRVTFQSLSAVGRDWRRDIGNETVSSPTTGQLLTAINEKQSSILLTGQPGSGKTCVMLAVQDELEDLIANTRQGLLPVFIQAREFADTSTAQDRQALGLPEKWVEHIARLADEMHVVVLIDSLDVLSIAREYSVLGYFLTQIDRLRLISNTTIVCACRDFDSRYDRRIADRSWDKHIACQPLDWVTDIEPLLIRLGIDASNIDATTHELIRNPRELALFVELAQQQGSFNVITGQALAQRYLATVVQQNRALGDAAMQAIENMAQEMLRNRSLSIAQQRFSGTDEILRSLLSNRVLHNTHDNQLTFAHQTLLDVLVISGAIRQGQTLNAFIGQLPPVPFIRPSIRSFVKQLSEGDKKAFRKQIRMVLTGQLAFHIRRLVAETFAEQKPDDDDWPLIRDLYSQHLEVFQAIYMKAEHLQWHHFWMEHLIPLLKQKGDLQTLTSHTFRVQLWINDDPEGITEFWKSTLQIEGFNKNQLVYPVTGAAEKVNACHLPLFAPLILQLLPVSKNDYRQIGKTLVRCIKNNCLDDTVLWQYIAGNVTDEDIIAYNFNNKLHCNPYDFGSKDDKFLAKRMQQSTTLLDLSITSIGQWSNIKHKDYDKPPLGYWHGFLDNTSYRFKHAQRDLHHAGDKHFLFKAVESAILHHAESHSPWWQEKRQRLITHSEGALRYFAVLACTSYPDNNLDIISSILTDPAMLESTLSYETGTLMHSAFLYLDAATQDIIQNNILTMHQEHANNQERQTWIIREKSQFLLAIPVHLRSAQATTILQEHEKTEWPLIRQAHIHSRGGTVQSPFSFTVFLEGSDNGILQLLAHYKDHERNRFDEFLVGGKKEVSRQLQEAAARAPLRFLHLLSSQWKEIDAVFRNSIMDGVANYLAYLYGNLGTNKEWKPAENPDAALLTQQILNELEGHYEHWHHNRAAAEVIEACANMIADSKNAERLVLLAQKFSSLIEESPIKGDSVSLIDIGINMVKGDAADALMILASQLTEKNIAWPESLADALCQFAKDENPAVRALILRRLPYLPKKHHDFSWHLFRLVMEDNLDNQLWIIAESCLYYAYHQFFELVEPWLQQLHQCGTGESLEVWGSIGALASLANHIDSTDLVSQLAQLDSADAWQGAMQVWTHPENIQQHLTLCLAGLNTATNPENQYAPQLTRLISSIFRPSPLIELPVELMQRYFNTLVATKDSSQRDPFGVEEWLNGIAAQNPAYALQVTEMYIAFAKSTGTYIHDHEHNLTQLLTRLFSQAEEQEESDNCEMLQRVVSLQDALLALGVREINEWLQAAERP